MIAISIAGFDPSGGAGILSDLKTFSALGVYGTGVITALTAQNVQRVSSILPIESDFIEEQIDLILEDLPVIYGKTGMLYSKEIIKSVSKKISEYDLKIVVDPVMVAGSGGSLSKEGMASAIKKYLLKEALIVTPNVFEAELLSGINIETQEDAIDAAHKIGKICDVVVTGGHLDGDNILYNGQISVISGELIESNNTHGSGCSFSAAIAAYMSKGTEMETAIKKADIFVKESIKHGHWGTLNQFWKNK
ncbi:MAG: bifunctional hydroxymethylpyrimidine kinase/phosphomethylpyrimidine kinase [Methanobacteriaceae archaeon]|nr:bifunctional hydroxymethylpyrimidine kinase/phosphomethylpyrimidine kinase [Methanobacteriaceae archaeon]MDP2835619.1 bifunctional hydroxymethylpyrimidine kinase/phosphomethylpyrimidine kinase [Methanobacteriaceae archaeon]MDP3033782.1 bifunctional hydroxymethylpyrimidine kinase/phosphomethylpyrimidine kinase [Methanobacteriaceae archaeon]MDP3484725.1 bifunctional hydroxymethylpyrimidine kinase/phosphomethylpyrimidine kinase [Methanobacteriaceae archaeon]